MFCSNCGFKMDESSTFCPNCGKATERSGNQQNNFNNQGGYSNMSTRNIVVCILLSIVTCGIYGIIWLIGMADDLNYASDRRNDTSGGIVFLLSLVTCGIYGLYWLYTAGEKVNILKRKKGLSQDSSNGILYLFLGIFGFSIISYCLIQNELNNYITN